MSALTGVFGTRTEIPNMFEELKMNLEYGNAICYSGYREGQCPGVSYPSYEEIKEELSKLRQEVALFSIRLSLIAEATEHLEKKVSN